MKQSWKTRIWEALALAKSPRRKQHQLGQSTNEEEDGRELLTAPNNEADSFELDDEFDTSDMKWREVTDKAAPSTSCAGRYASIVASSILLVFLIVGLIMISTTEIRDKLKQNETSPAQDDRTVRKEWRALSITEKDSYISALRCLQRVPPALTHMPPNASGYSDYPYVHAHIGYRTHNSASFLPWHRYFLHLYESRLREECDYAGGIPYWDWTLDAEDLASSPLFDAQTGFGGDGARDKEITVGRHGRCVTEGPFAGLQVLWYDVKYQPHCLSRGFRTDAEGGQGSIDGTALRPAEIEAILGLGSYEDFVTALEKKVHDVIPFGVGGDFETFSAPFEPLFWLHHSQLDRLWCLWQKESPDRLYEYGGHRFRHSIQMADLEDPLEVRSELGPNIRVKDVMAVDGNCGSGEDGVLCYRYR